jgi:alpha-galactosidase
MTNINVQRLAVEAGMTGDPEKVVQACAMDPLTAASSLTLKEIREMATEMLEAEAQWLPQFAGRKPRPTPTIATPKGTPHANVPVDPALAIAARFGELAS